MDIVNDGTLNLLAIGNYTCKISEGAGNQVAPQENVLHQKQWADAAYTTTFFAVYIKWLKAENIAQYHFPVIEMIK
jgi:hypothetical protein